MNNSKVGFALTKCYFCNKDNTIMMNTRLGEPFASRVESMHGHVVNMMPCRECENWMKQGVILITIDDKKSEKDWNKQRIPNPYRTGGWFVVKDEAIRQLMDCGPRSKAAADFAIKHRFMFIEHEAAEMAGLFEAAQEAPKG